MNTGLVYDPLYLEHDTGAHVENSQRLVETVKVLQDSGLMNRLALISPRPASIEELCLVHTEYHTGHVQRAASKGGEWLDGDTYCSPESFTVALHAAGGVLRGVDAIMNKEVANAFALVRPPGHHATPDQAMGFCLFNNIAVAAKYARAGFGLTRILIADFDVHHGNGTEEVFYEDPSVFYFSTHQYPHYPGTGAITDQGSGEGRGTTLNIPLPAGCGDAEYLRAYREILVPLAQRFKPELILVSAGYDLHWADPLSGMQLTVDGLAEIVGIIKGLADELCGGRLLLTLEGGYHLKALAYSIKATLEVLLGGPRSADPLGKPQVTYMPAKIDHIFERLSRDLA
ncbi:MAG: histone deacetylase [Dehalococcoidia bacterium]|nr:histone deacetylase [Dehalococcoidia bacterium]